MRIVQLSDTHLSHLGGVMNENFSQLVDFVNDVLKPDLVVNSGDIVLLSPDIAEDYEYARGWHMSASTHRCGSSRGTTMSACLETTPGWASPQRASGSPTFAVRSAPTASWNSRARPGQSSA